MFSDFLKLKSMASLKRKVFTPMFTLLVREEFNLGLRNNLMGSNEKQRGVPPFRVVRVVRGQNMLGGVSWSNGITTAKNMLGGQNIYGNTTSLGSKLSSVLQVEVIQPMLIAVVPQVVQTTGAEDTNELVQDGMCMAAQSVLHQFSVVFRTRGFDELGYDRAEHRLDHVEQQHTRLWTHWDPPAIASGPTQPPRLMVDRRGRQEVRGNSTLDIMPGCRGVVGAEFPCLDRYLACRSGRGRNHGIVPWKDGVLRLVRWPQTNLPVA